MGKIYCMFLNKSHLCLIGCCLWVNRANLSIVKELGDRAAQGRTFGNLGNTYYLLGDFGKAVASHEQVPLNSEYQCVRKSKNELIQVLVFAGVFYFSVY